MFLVPQRERGEHAKKPQQSNCIEKMLGSVVKKKLRREILLSHDGSLGEQAELRVEEKKIPSSF